VNLNDRLQEIVRIDREIAELHKETNVILMSNRTPFTELHRQRSHHVKVIQSYQPSGATR
jgi:hypothetical protein